MDLSNLKPAEGSKHSDNFRRGRGHGSEMVRQLVKVIKDRKARSGSPRPGFEGGQMPLYRRILREDSLISIQRYRWYQCYCIRKIRKCSCYS